MYVCVCCVCVCHGASAQDRQTPKHTFNATNMCGLLPHCIHKLLVRSYNRGADKLTPLIHTTIHMLGGGVCCRLYVPILYIYKLLVRSHNRGADELAQDHKHTIARQRHKQRSLGVSHKTNRRQSQGRCEQPPDVLKKIEKKNQNMHYINHRSSQRMQNALYLGPKDHPRRDICCFKLHPHARPHGVVGTHRHCGNQEGEHVRHRWRPRGHEREDKY